MDTTRLAYYFEMGKRLKPVSAGEKVFNYLKYKTLPKKAVVPVSRYTPQIASLLISKRCNLTCSYCSAGAAIEDNANLKKSDANLDRVKQIFENPLFKKCVLVDLLGGEPLLVEDVVDIVEYLSSKGFLINTSTNGILLYKKIQGLKDAGITRINISIYDENIRVLRRDMKKINAIFPVHTSFVLTKSNLTNEYDEIVKNAIFMRDAGCLSLRFWMYRPMGLDPDVNEIIDMKSELYQGLKKELMEKVPGFCFFPSDLDQEKVNLNKVCAQPWQRITVDMMGNMGICCGTEDQLKGVNLFHTRPDDIYNHPTLVSIRENILNPEIDPPDLCKGCNLLSDPGW